VLNIQHLQFSLWVLSGRLSKPKIVFGIAPALNLIFSIAMLRFRLKAMGDSRSSNPVSQGFLL